VIGTIIEELVLNGIKKDIEIANSHLEYHVNNEGKILSLDENCEYCKIHLNEDKLLNKTTWPSFNSIQFLLYQQESIVL